MYHILFGNPYGGWIGCPNHPLQVNLDPPPPHHHPIYTHFFQNEPTLMFAVPLAAPVRWQPEMGYQLGQLFQKKGVGLYGEMDRCIHIKTPIKTV
jgi:hypothetical protein